MSMSVLLNDANRAIQQAQQLVNSGRAEDIRTIEKSLKTSKEKLSQMTGSSLSADQAKMAKSMLDTIKTTLSNKPGRQAEEAAGGQQAAVQIVLKALKELQSTLEQMKSDAEKNKRTVTGSQGSSSS